MGILNWIIYQMLTHLDSYFINKSNLLHTIVKITFYKRVNIIGLQCLAKKCNFSNIIFITQAAHLAKGDSPSGRVRHCQVKALPPSR